MLIELQNKKTIRSENIASLKRIDMQWFIKLSNSYEVKISDEELEWIMTIVGNLVMIHENLAIYIDSIIMFEPNENGYLIGWSGEPPIEIEKEKAMLLIDMLINQNQHIVLSERVQFLKDNEILPEYKVL